jgi:hypothetical protein
MDTLWYLWFQVPDKRGVSAVWANVERATRSKPFLGTTNSLATMQDPKVFLHPVIRGMRSLKRVHAWRNVAASSKPSQRMEHEKSNKKRTIFIPLFWISPCIQLFIHPPIILGRFQLLGQRARMAGGLQEAISRTAAERTRAAEQPPSRFWHAFDQRRSSGDERRKK